MLLTQIYSSTLRIVVPAVPVSDHRKSQPVPVSAVPRTEGDKGGTDIIAALAVIRSTSRTISLHPGS